MAYASVTLVVNDRGDGTGTTLPLTPLDWQLTTYTSRKKDMLLVGPRPDSETPARARHRKAHSGMPYVAYIDVQFGSFPYYCDLISAPNGVVTDPEFVVSGDVLVRPTNYMKLVWDSPKLTDMPVGGWDISGRILDQDYNRGASPSTGLEFSYKVVVDDDSFVFVDNVNGSDETGTGSIESPYATMSFLGTDNTVTTYQDKIIVLRGSATAYALPAMVNANNNFTIGSGLPSSIMGFPGEAAILEEVSGWINITGASDVEFLNLTIRHETSFDTKNSQKIFAGLSGGDRHYFHGLTFTRHNIGVVNSENPAIFHYALAENEYIGISDIEVFGTVGSLCNIFTPRKMLIDNVIVHDSTLLGDEASSNPQFIRLKDNPVDVTVRCVEMWDNITWGGVYGIYSCMGIGGQSGSQDVEFCYNKIKHPSTDGEDQNKGAVLEWGTTFTALADNTWWYRNSIDQRFKSMGAGDNVTNEFVDDNVLNIGTFPPETYITYSGNIDGSVYLDESMKLIGEYRTLYLGSKGAEIAEAA